MQNVKGTIEGLRLLAVDGPRVTVASTRGKLTGRALLVLALATWGVGFIRLAPATWGSAIGIGLYMLVRAGITQPLALAAAYGWGAPQLELFRVTLLLAVLIPLAIVGVWAATQAESLFGHKDPRPVVVDEVVGQFITLLFVPFDAGAWALVAGFFVFRAFDILKPYPVRRLEALESGLGIMADDVLAGAYAGAFMAVVCSVYLLL